MSAWRLFRISRLAKPGFLFYCNTILRFPLPVESSLNFPLLIEPHNGIVWKRELFSIFLMEGDQSKSLNHQPCAKCHFFLGLRNFQDCSRDSTSQMWCFVPKCPFNPSIVPGTYRNETQHWKIRSFKMFQHDLPLATPKQFQKLNSNLKQAEKWKIRLCVRIFLCVCVFFPFGGGGSITARWKWWFYRGRVGADPFWFAHG